LQCYPQIFSVKLNFKAWFKILLYHFFTGNFQCTTLRKTAQHYVSYLCRINAGFFVFRKEIFNYIKPGEELVVEPFQRLIAEKKIIGYPADHFWCMDTFKEHQELTDMFNLGNTPWEVWKKATGGDRRE